MITFLIINKRNKVKAITVMWLPWLFSASLCSLKKMVAETINIVFTYTSKRHFWNIISYLIAIFPCHSGCYIHVNCIHKNFEICKSHVRVCASRSARVYARICRDLILQSNLAEITREYLIICAISLSIRKDDSGTAVGNTASPGEFALPWRYPPQIFRPTRVIR